jgi:hypothetical protein
MMTAEKSADLILGREPLPAEPVQFYRHTKGEQKTNGRFAAETAAPHEAPVRP